MEKENINQHFLTIVMMFATSCWQYLGKIPNQISGKTEKDLPHAQMAIEILNMLSQKMKGNLTSDEEKMLLNTLTDLQLNYADEVNKESKTQPQPAKEEKKADNNKTEPQVKEENKTEAAKPETQTNK